MAFGANKGYFPKTRALLSFSFFLPQKIVRRQYDAALLSEKEWRSNDGG